MAVTINAKYKGGKKIELIHEQSGTSIQTDAPKDNNGDGSSFSPTDLAASSLIACIMTIMTIKAEQKQIALDGMHGSVIKEMSQEPRRIGKLTLEIHMPSGLSEKERKLFEAVAQTCPVHYSLHPEITVASEFIYDV
jgi:putative redox protein